MSDVSVRVEGRAGRITLTRPKALNALNHPMARAIEAAIDGWRDDPAIEMVIIDAEGERAFCAGGDIAQVYHDAKAGNLASGREFWREEYRMNAKLADYPKPIAALMQGFVMGGGVGLGGHVRHRIVGATTRVAMPECGIGLVPDVGGSYLLARAPGRIGEYLGLTGARMNAADAILAGFADQYVPEERWPDLIARLVETADPTVIETFAETAPEGELALHRDTIDHAFAGAAGSEILARLDADGSAFATSAALTLRRNSPLSMACTLQLVRDARGLASVREALVREYRYTYRSLDQTDLLEGIRAQVIDKDRQPRWKHRDIAEVSLDEVAALLSPLGSEELDFRD